MIHFVKYFISTILIVSYLHIANSQIQLGSDILGQDSIHIGQSVSLSADGEILAMGIPSSFGPGKVIIYHFINGEWNILGQEIVGDTLDYNFGFSTDLTDDGKRIIIGNYNGNYVKIFELKNNNWVQVGQSILGGPRIIDFGKAVAISSSGKMVAISACDYPSPIDRHGKVDVYEENNGIWIQLGNEIFGESKVDQAGWSISLSSDGQIIAIGSPGSNINGTHSGKVRVFEYKNNEWEQLGYDINGKGKTYSFGYSLSLSSDGNTLAVGAIGHESLMGDPCYVSVYNFDGYNWNKLGEDIDGFSGELFGWVVSISKDGKIVAVSSPENKNCPVRIFELVDNSWKHFGNSIKDENGLNDIGYSIDLSKNGNVIAVSSDVPNGFIKIFDISDIRVNTNMPECTFIKDTMVIDTVIDEIILYPNPTTGKLFIQGINLDSISNIKINIYDILGRVSWVNLNTNKEIDISSFSSGFYTIYFNNKRFKIIKVDN